MGGAWLRIHKAGGRGPERAWLGEPVKKCWGSEGHHERGEGRGQALLRKAEAEIEPSRGHTKSRQGAEASAR